MTHSEHLSSNNTEPTLDPQLVEKLLSERLEYLRVLGMDHHLVEAYSSSTDSIYVYPGMSPLFTGLMSEEKSYNLENFSDDYAYVYNRQLIPEEADKTSRVVRRNLKRSHAPTGAIYIHNYQQDEDGKKAISNVYTTQSDGLERRYTVRQLGGSNRLHYFFEHDHGSDNDVQGFDVYIPFIMFAFGEDLDSQSITEAQLANRLREIVPIDLSLAMLDARFDHFSAVAQLEASCMFIHDLRSLGGLGAARRSALILAAKYRDTLLSDDYEGRIAMSNELSAAFHRSALREHDPQAKRLLKAYSRRSESNAQSLLVMREGFKPVYEHLGYILPVTLRPPLGRVDAISIHPVERPKSEIFNQKDSSDESQPSIVAEIQFQTEQLHLRAEAYVHEWRLSAKKRRELGFDSMQRELMVGFKNFAGSQLLPPMRKEDAQQIADYLHGLHGLVLLNGEARDALDKSILRQRDLEEDCQLVQMIANESGVVIRLPIIEPVASYVAIFKQDWQTFRQVVLKTWPNYEGIIAAQKLELLLFEQQPHVTDDEATQGAISLQKEIAQQLDKIILPPGASKTDLERELVRVKASKTTVSWVDWQRLSDLIEIRSQFDGLLFRSKDGSLGSRPPYFVAVIELDGDTFAIAESPVFGNATYVVSERHSAGTWLEVMELTKSDAQTVGAYRVVHPQNGKQRASHVRHIDKLYDKIIDLHISTSE